MRQVILVVEHSAHDLVVKPARAELKKPTPLLATPV